MRGEFINIEDLELMRVKQIADRMQGKIGIMLLVDSIELIIRYKLEKMRELHRDDPLRF